MPSTSKKQHNFMAAIAHSPSFAKKVGVSQSVGKDFTAADKGKKFRTGGRPAAINKQNTQHGSMDMPFKSLKKFAGMKAGGKVKKYVEGDEVSNDNDRPFAETNATEERTTTREVPRESATPAPAKSTGSADFKAAFAAARKAGDKTFEYKGASYGTGFKQPEYRDEGRNVPRKETVTETIATPAVTGRAAKESKYMPSDEQKEENTKRFRDVTMTAASMVPVGRAVSLGASALKAASAARAARTAGAMEKAAEGTARQVRLRTPEARNSILDEVRKRVIKGGKDENSFTSRAKDTMRGEGGLKKGGNVKYNFEKSGKDVEKKGMKEGSKAEMALDKKQMPMKSGKPAFMMKKGGMAKYAKGGGIESRGKTKGTVIRMASGGSVSSASRRADGIAQRGKTRC